MDERKIDFASLEWESPIPGARYKAVQRDDWRLRLIEFTKEFIEPDWCTKEHIGYVLRGEMDVDFDGRIVRFSAGDGLMLPKGEENRHKATVITDLVELLLVEDLYDAEPMNL